MVDRLRPVASAIRRSLSPQACFNRRTSRIFRIGALSAGIGPPLASAQKEATCAIRSPPARGLKPPTTGWPDWIGMGGRLPSERVADLRRNQWPHWLGLRTAL